MNDRKLEHVVQCFKNLDGKSFGECNRKSLEIVIFDKLVEINAKHFKTNADMWPEGKVGIDPYDVFTVLMVLISEGLQYFDLNLTLLMELLPVLEDLDGHMLFSLMIKAPEYHTEGSSSKFLLNFISE